MERKVNTKNKYVIPAKAGIQPWVGDIMEKLLRSVGELLGK